jgi:uncharacterized integral membrane protein
MVAEHEVQQRERRSPAHMLRLVLGALLVALVVAVVVDNRGSVRFHYLVGDVRAPLVLIVLVSALVGAAIGWLLLHRPHHS